jgi:hypothetical protein
MAVSTWKLGDSVQNESVNTESKNSRNTRSIVISVQGNQRKLVSKKDLQELKFDLDEMQDLLTMTTYPHVRGLLLS